MIEVARVHVWRCCLKSQWLVARSCAEPQCYLLNSRVLSTAAYVVHQTAVPLLCCVQGPSASIDTACSASLVALHMAARSLCDGSADSALVAGVMLSLVPQSTLMVQRAGMLAADGRCKVLDAAADGYVRGEVCRAMWLEASVAEAAAASSSTDATPGTTASGAVRASVPLAVVLGTAVNTNGRASSLTAPHGPTQQALITAALDAAGMAPEQVSGLQLHANGTSLGDPIEVGAVVPAYKLLLQADTSPDSSGSSSSSGSRPFVLSSIKGFAGHSEAAAGAVGVLEAVSVMVQQALAPALHVRQLNPYVAAPLQGCSAALNRSTSLAPVPVWQQGSATTAGDAGTVAMGVSSFGAQGTNAHAILGHTHSWALQQGIGIASSSGQLAESTSSSARQLLWQGQRFWVAPIHQRLISRALVSHVKRARGLPSLKVAFEARLDAPGLAHLWSYLSTPTSPDESAQSFLCNSVLLAAAASAGSLLVSTSSSSASRDQQHLLVLHDAVMAPPQMLPAHPGQPGLQPPVLLVACNISTGSCVVDIEGQRQVQCSLAGLTSGQAAQDSACREVASAGAPAHASAPALASRLQALLGRQLQPVAVAAAAAARSALPAALVAPDKQHRQHSHVVSTLTTPGSCSSSSSSNDGYVLNPAELEACLQCCMVTPGQATALWLSTVQAVTVPLQAQDGSHARPNSLVAAASFAHAADGSSCQVHTLSHGSCVGRSTLSLVGALLAADASTATEAAAAHAEAAAGVTDEVTAAAAALSAVTASTNPLLQLDEDERGLYLQAQIMSEVRVMHSLNLQNINVSLCCSCCLHLC